MALNFLGLGFSFGAKDAGLEKRQRAITAGFQTMNHMASLLGLDASRALTDVANAFTPVGSRITDQLKLGKTYAAWLSTDLVLAAQAFGKKFAPAFEPAAKAQGRLVAGVAEIQDRLAALSTRAAVALKPFIQNLAPAKKALDGLVDGVVQASNAVDSRFAKIGGAVQSVAAAFKKYGPAMAAQAIAPFKRVADKIRQEVELDLGVATKMASGFRKIGKEIADSIRGGSKEEQLLKRDSESTFRLATKFRKKVTGLVTDGLDWITRSTGGVRNSMETLNKILAQNKLQTFIESIALDKLNKIGDSMQHLAKHGENLTTSFEAEGVRLGAEAQGFVANLGLVGKEGAAMASKMAGGARALNISVSELGDAMLAYKGNADILKTAGINSAEDLAKAHHVMGLDVLELTSTLRGLQKQGGLTDKGIKEVVNSFVAMGGATGKVGDAMHALPEVMAQVATLNARLGKTMSPEKAADFAKQIAVTAVAFKSLGNTQAQAISKATDLAKTLVEHQTNLRDMAAGVETDLGQLPQSLAIVTGDINESFKLLASGPEGMILGLKKMRDAAKKSGKDINVTMGFVASHLTKALGPEAAQQVIAFMNSADDATLKTMASVRKGTKSLGELAKSGFSTGGTLEDSFNMAKDAAVTSFRALGHAREDFVKASGKQFGEFTATLKAVVKKGGPLGAIVEKFADMNAIGAKALLPQTLRPMAAVMGEILTHAAPLVGMFGALGFRVSMLLSPTGLLIAGITALAVMFLDAKAKGMKFGAYLKDLANNIKKNLLKWAGLDNTKSWGDAIAGLWAKAKAKLSELYDGFADAFSEVGDVVEKASDWLAKKASEFDWTAFFTSLFAKVGSAVRGALGFLVDALGNVWTGVTGGLDPKKGKAKSQLGKILGSITTALKAMFMGAFDALKQIDWSGLLSDALKGLSAGFDLLMGALKKVDWAGLLNSALDGLRKVMEVLVGAVIDYLPGVLSALWGLLKGAMAVILSVADSLVQGLIDGVSARFPKIGAVLQAVFDVIKATVGPTLAVLTGGLGYVVDAFKWLFDVIEKGWDYLFGHSIVPDWFEAAFSFIHKVLDGFKAFFDKVFVAARTIAEFVISGIIAGFKLWKTVVFAVLGFIESYVTFVFGVVEKVIGAALAAASVLWDLFKVGVTTIVTGIRDMVVAYFAYIQRMMTDPIAEVTKIWSTLTGFVTGLFSGIQQIISDDVDAVVGKFTWLYDKGKEALGGIMDVAKSLFGHSINTYVGKDMEETVGVMTDASARIAAILKEKVFDAVVDGLTKAFSEAFRKMTLSFDKFSGKLVDKFVEMTTRMKKAWADLFVNLYTMADAAITPVLRTIQDLTRQLDALNAIFLATTAARVGLAEMKTTPEGRDADKQLGNPMSTAPEEDNSPGALLRAVNKPRWVEIMLEAHLTTIEGLLSAQTAAIAKLGAAAVGGGGGPRLSPDEVSRRVGAAGGLGAPTRDKTGHLRFSGPNK